MQIFLAAISVNKSLVRFSFLIVFTWPQLTIAAYVIARFKNGDALILDENNFFKVEHESFFIPSGLI